MADRTIYVGDDYREAKFQFADESGYLTTLPTASSIVAEFVGANGTFSGTCIVIDPPEADDDGLHHWNAKYVFAVGDSASADLYNVYGRVWWSAGADLETYALATLEVKEITGP